MKPSPSTERVYLDHAATAPLRPEVAEQLAQDLADGVGGAGWANPSSQHSSGRRRSAMLAQARARIATVLGADPHEVVLTSGGTEADALALTGRVLSARTAGDPHPRLVVSPVEHPAVLDTARACELLHGAQVSILEADEAGRVRPESLRSALEQGPTALVSVMAANNETGVVQDVPSLVTVARQAGGGARPGQPGYVPVHCDAVAAVGRVPVDMNGWGVDALTVSGHKLGATVGVGALLARRDLALTAPSGGGRQERGLRSGTQDVLGARALALALELAVAEREQEAARLEGLRQRLLAGARTMPGAHLTLGQDVEHLPGTAHLWFEDVDVQALLMGLDLAGIDASAGSACHAGVSRPSHVLLAMGLGQDAASATLRCTMGAGTCEQDVERLLAVLPGALEGARRTRGAWQR